jgi:hypothetical protein
MGIAGDKPRQLAPTVGTTGAGSSNTIDMTFESSIKIFNAVIAKIFKSAIMASDSADMVFVAAIAKRFDLLIERKFESASRKNSTPASEEIRPRRLEEIRPRRLEEIRLEEIRPRRLKKFDPGVSKKFDPGV